MTVQTVRQVCLLNRSYQDKGFTHCSNSLTSRQQIQCVLKAAAVILHSSSKSGWKLGKDPVDTVGRTWLSQTRPLELALELDSGHRVYLCLHRAVGAARVKKGWEHASAARPRAGTSVVMPRYSPVSKSTPLAPPDRRSWFDSCVLVHNNGCDLLSWFMLR